MKYKYAMSIATKCDGTIRCKYATIYDGNGRRLFSLQDENFVTRKLMEEWDGQVLHMYDGESSISENDTLTMDLAFSQVAVSEAVVTAVKYSEERMVPVVLCANVVQALHKAYQQSMEKYKLFSNWYDKTLEDLEESPSDRGLQVRKENLEKQLERWEILSRRRQSHYEKALNGMTFYVRPASFHWYPLNSESVSVDLEKAKKELDMAKVLLTASSVATAI